jgi:hypothetical protein
MMMMMMEGRKGRKERGMRRECLLSREEMKLRAKDSVDTRTTGERRGEGGEMGSCKTIGIGIFTNCLSSITRPRTYTHTHTSSLPRLLTNKQCAASTHHSCTQI